MGDRNGALQGRLTTLRERLVRRQNTLARVGPVGRLDVDGAGWCTRVRTRVGYLNAHVHLSGVGRLHADDRSAVADVRPAVDCHQNYHDDGDQDKEDEYRQKAPASASFGYCHRFDLPLRVLSSQFLYPFWAKLGPGNHEGVGRPGYGTIPTDPSPPSGQKFGWAHQSATQRV